MLKNKLFVVLLVIVILGLVSAAALSIKNSRGRGTVSETPTFVVKRGPLTISVIESGTVKARDIVIIKSEVEGRTSIISLVPEGTRVKKGDLLVELDASVLLDKKIDQEIKVQNAYAAYINANENLAVVENQAQSDIDKAELTLEFAKQDLEKYQQGEYPNELRQAQAQITLAEEELSRARETLKWSQKLYEEKYISQTELQADQLAERKKALDVELAKSNLELLTKFTYKRMIAQLRSDVNQADMALERTRRKAKADIAQAQATLKAKEAEYRRQQDKLEKILDQITKTKIYAPADGLVIYATSARRRGWRSNVEPLDEGQQVLERQELIYLPTTSSTNVEVDVHESNLEKVRPGLPAIVTVDAVKGKKYFGKVERIAPLPDAQSVWLNPDLKVYNTEIYLDTNDPNLRTGMSCQVEIIIARYDDVLYVPVQAVTRVAGRPTVYIVTDGKLEPRPVEAGLDNNRMIVIKSGLEEGEVVSLTPPLAQAELKHTGAETRRLLDHTQQQGPSISEKVSETLERLNHNTGSRPDTAGRQRRRKGTTAAKRAPESLSEQEKRKLREQFKNMSPQQRQQLKNRIEQMRSEDRQPGR